MEAAQSGESHLTEEVKSTLIKQVEYYFSDENLKHDEYFHNMIKNSPTESIPVEALLKCNKIKKLGVSKQDLVTVIAGSHELEATADGEGIKRKNSRALPDYEPKVTKKVKTDKKHHENGNGDEEHKPFQAKVLKLTLSEAKEDLKWNEIQSSIEKEVGIQKINYTRVNGTEGHIAVDQNSVPAETLQKLIGATVKIGDVEVKVEDCLGDDLKKFYNEHGSHMDMCLERAGLKKKQRKPKGQQQQDNADFIFDNNRYTTIAPLKMAFKNIIAKTGNDEVITESEQKLLLELLKHHDNYEEKVKDLHHFTVGEHPTYKETRCFFIVRNDGTKEDFSFTKCLEKLKNKEAKKD